MTLQTWYCQYCGDAADISTEAAWPIHCLYCDASTWASQPPASMIHERAERNARDAYSGQREDS